MGSYSNSKDQISLEEAYKTVHNEEVVEEGSMDLVNQAIQMVGQAWQEFDHAKTYAQLSPQDKQVIDTFWDYTKALAGLCVFFGLGFPIVSELVNMANNFFKVKNRRSVSFSDYLNSVKGKILNLKKLKDMGKMEEGKMAAEKALVEIKKGYEQNHNGDLEERIGNLPK
jgi:hypothetical protein